MKRKRYAWDVAKKYQKRRRITPGSTRLTVMQGGNTRTFVQRSYGSPLAITERKYFDASRAALAIPQWSATTAGGELDPATGNALFFPVQGDDYNNRQGRKVHVLAIKIRGTINIPVANDQVAAQVTPTIRLAVVQDTQTNSAQLNSEDVINSTMYGYQNPAFFGRFKVLKDKWFALPAPFRTWDGTNNQQSGYQKPFKMTIKFRKPVCVHYNSTNGGTVADVIDHSFHVIGGASDINLSPSIGYTVRTTFVDI